MQPSCLTVFQNVRKLARRSRISDRLPSVENFICHLREICLRKKFAEILTVFRKTAEHGMNPSLELLLVYLPIVAYIL